MKAPNKGESTESLTRALDLLQHHCLLGQLHYRNWSRLNDSFRKSPAVGNLAPIFFLFTADAHLNSALLILNRLVDKRRDSLSIRTFLRRASAGSQLFPHCTPAKLRENTSADLKRLDSFEVTLEKIRTHRNEQFVHLSESLLEPPFGVIPTKDAFAYTEIITVLTAIGQTLNRYDLFLRDSEMLMEVFREAQEFSYLMNKLGEVVDEPPDAPVA